MVTMSLSGRRDEWQRFAQAEDLTYGIYNHLWQRHFCTGFSVLRFELWGTFMLHPTEA